MGNFLALIRKEDFIDLFKYGSLHINRDMIRMFSCKVEELTKREPIFNDLSNFANAFDSTFEYLFIYYENLYGRENDVNIGDVRGVYPLDYEAKKELSLSLDHRIIINDPLWPSAIYNLQKKQSLQDSKNGVSNIWEIYNLRDSIDYINTIVCDAVLKEVIDEFYENRRPAEKLPIWVYIMRYERHAFYPNNTIGAFMDAVNAILNHKAGREVDSSEIESTMIMQFFQSLNDSNPKITFKEIIQEMSKKTEAGILNFLSYIKGVSSDFDLIKIASLFYIYRDRYKEEFKYEQSWEEYGKSNGIEFSIACYMLGCILGHKHTYDCLYEHLPLTIFKKKRVEPIKKKNETKEDAVDPIEDESISKDYKTTSKILPKFPCKMGKPKKGGGFSKSSKPKQVQDINEYRKLESQGWKEIIENKE